MPQQFLSKSNQNNNIFIKKQKTKQLFCYNTPVKNIAYSARNEILSSAVTGQASQTAG